LGFTLAEVLITLGIIGVVAALTLPTLIANHKKQVYVASLKTFYSQMSQAVQKMRADTGCNDMNCMGLGSSIGDDEWNDNLYNLVSSQMSIVKYYKKPSRKERVMFYDLEKAHSYCDFSCLTLGSSKDVVFYTKNGFKFETFTVNPERGISLYVDTNSDKKPNIMGRDVFSFYIPNDMSEVVPQFGYKYSHIYYKNPSVWWKNASGLCTNGSTYNANGTGCGARIIESGWKMDY